MEKNMENEMETGFIQGFRLGFASSVLNSRLHLLKKIRECLAASQSNWPRGLFSKLMLKMTKDIAAITCKMHLDLNTVMDHKAIAARSTLEEQEG